MCQSVDCYDTDPGGQATYHDGHKITFNENELKLWNVEFWWLKNLLWKPYKSDYIQSFLRPQLVESFALVEMLCTHLVKEYNNYTLTLIIYKANRHFSFLPITYFP